MNSLKTISRKVVIATLIVAAFAVSAAAQTVQPRQQGKMYGDAGFVGEPINLNVVDADVRDILSYITEQYGVNFVIDKSVKATPVTVNVSGVPWNIALDSVLQSQELGVQVNGTILRVADSKLLATEGEVFRLRQDNQLDTAVLYTEFVRLNYARAKDTIVRGSSTTGMATGGSLTPQYVLAGTGLGVQPPQAPAAGAGEGLLPIIQRRLSRRGSVEVDSRSNSLIITDVRENIDAIKQLVAILDQPEPQVEIEARIVVATRGFSRALGAQLSASVTGARGSGATFDAKPDLPSVPNTLLGLTTGIFGTAQISLAIQAGEQKNQLKVIATPRVTTLNNRKAKIESGSKIPITTIQPGTNSDVAIFTTTYIDVPLKLEITPQITDVGTIVLDVLAENSSIPEVVQGVAPAINSQLMQTQVTVPDGGTTVVGGVMFDDEREAQDRTPGLSKIPILGLLFKRKDVSRDTTEILFFITPRIYRPDYATATPGSSGTRTGASIIQPVPMGNPSSNSDNKNNQQPQPVLPVIQPTTTTQPVKP